MVNALGLKNRDDWRRWSRTERPPDIPSEPWKIYKNAGWNGFADWLGKKKRPEFFCPEEAEKVVNSLGLKGWDDWCRWSRTERPPEIPSAPWKIYKNAGWNGLADWLGKKKRPEFLPYEEAKKVVNALGLKSRDDWKRWSCAERPPDPSSPWRSYKNAGWNGLADWLGKKKRPVDLSRANDMAFLNPHRPRIQIEENEDRGANAFHILRIATREQFWLSDRDTSAKTFVSDFNKEEKYRLTSNSIPWKKKDFEFIRWGSNQANMQSCAQAQINSRKSPFLLSKLF